jgi:hypothetical protein
MIDKHTIYETRLSGSALARNLTYENLFDQRLDAYTRNVGLPKATRHSTTTIVRHRTSAQPDLRSFVSPSA